MSLWEKWWEAPGNEIWIGERVVGEINIVCGDARPVKQEGRITVENRTDWALQVMMGSSPTISLCRLRTCISSLSVYRTKRAVFTEPLAAALEIQSRSKSNPVSCFGCRRRPVGFADCSNAAVNRL